MSVTEKKQTTKKRKSIRELFDLMPEWEASDLHLKAGSPPIYRVAGKLRRTKAAPLSEDDIEDMVFGFLSERQAETLREKGHVDMGYDISAGRVRVNAFYQRGKLGLVGRLIETEIPSLESLNLPPQLSKVIEYSQGLVLVCGVTGSGKSTTLASLLDMVNRTYQEHILTIEDPIEFLHDDKKCIVNQREMGLDCHDWPEALAAAMREDPDVILVGEMRDTETFQAALTASETGHLVFGTMHTSSAAGTIPRILDLFPTSKHALIRQSLAKNLNAIIGQKLLPSCAEDVARVPVVEYMIKNPSIRKAIEEANYEQITGLIAEGENEGMITWTKSFVDMINADLIDKRTAKRYAPNAEKVEMALKGIEVSTSTLNE